MRNNRQVLNQKLSGVIWGLLLGILLPGSAPAQTLQLTDNYGQTIKGWGVFEYTRETTWNHEKFNVINSPTGTDAVFRDLNASIVRFNLIPQCFSASASDGLNHQKLDELKDTILMAKSKGIAEYCLSVWSPPAEMKFPATTNGKAWVENSTGNIVSWFSGISSDPNYTQYATTLREDKEAEYIQYVVNAITYLHENGAGLPQSFSLQNEPGWTPDYDATHYHYTQYHRMVKSVKSAFNANGLEDVGVVFGDCNAAAWLLWNSHLYLNYQFSKLDNDAELRDSIDVIASHSYDNWTDDFNNRVSQAAMAADGMWRKKNAYGYEIMMTEWIPDRDADTDGLTGIQYTIYEMEHVLRDLRIFPYEYFIWFTSWGVRTYATPEIEEKSDLLAWNEGSVDGELHKTKLYYIFQKLWGEVPYNGGYRVQYMTSSDPDIKADTGNIVVNALAFEGEDKTVVVLINPTPTTKTFSLSGLDAYASAEWFTTTSTQDMVSNGTLILSAGATTLTLLGESIHILVGSNETVIQDQVSFDTVPLSLTAGETYTLTVDYAAEADRFIQTKLYDNNSSSWQSVTGAEQVLHVSAGSGTLTYNITIPVGTALGNHYIWSTKMYSNWSTSHGSDSRSNIVVSDAPSVPQNLTATPISTSQINLSWDISSGNIQGYDIIRNGQWIDVALTSTYTDTGLSADTTYTYNVAAFDAADNTSANSAPASAKTDAPVTRIDAVSFDSPPLTLSAGETYTITVDYSAVGDRFIQTKLYDNNSGNWQSVVGAEQVLNVSAGSGTLSYSITLPANLAAGTHYIWSTKMYENWSTAKASDTRSNIVVPLTLLEDSVSFDTLPLTLTAGETYTVTVDYTAAGNRFIQTKLYDNNSGSWQSVTGAEQVKNVITNSGTLTFSITLPAGTLPGTQYIWSTKMYENWSTAKASETRSQVEVSAPSS
ncbi:fibronectin type III domain-containing protein [Kiritimatiellota bacterium B12222]|nr:fibronectin type III domain-containing protein [Kiritimatiellota bacterium B12222]